MLGLFGGRSYFQGNRVSSVFLTSSLTLYCSGLGAATCLTQLACWGGNLYGKDGNEQLVGSKQGLWFPKHCYKTLHQNIKPNQVGLISQAGHKCKKLSSHFIKNLSIRSVGIIAMRNSRVQTVNHLCLCESFYFDVDTLEGFHLQELQGVSKHICSYIQTNFWSISGQNIIAYIYLDILVSNRVVSTQQKIDWLTENQSFSRTLNPSVLNIIRILSVVIMYINIH